MANLTLFGKELRKLRIDRDMRLYDLAQALGISAAMISAIETGRKPIPDRFVLDVSRAMDLKTDEIRALRSAKEKTLKEVRVDHLSAERREIVAAFARSLNDLSPELLERIRKNVLKSIEGETPFKRRRGMTVPPTSYVKLEALANKVRMIFCGDSLGRLPIVEIIELRLPKILTNFVFDVRDRIEMGSAEGLVVNGERTLILRSEVYDAACRGEARARFTASHELGHFVMHHELGFARAACDSDPIYCDAEWQADSFAGFLMMPRSRAVTFSNVEHAAQECGMSPQAAKVQLSRYGVAA